ncbi:MAG: aldehyde dehydrogenase family protein, partial [Gemmatimonadota bacterium]
MSGAPSDRLAPDRLFIGGEWVEGEAGSRFATLNPATGKTLAEVAEARAEDVGAAVTAARAAMRGPWRSMAPADRAALLWKISSAIEARADELVRLECLDNGKPIREARIDIREAIDAFRYYAGWTTKLEGETIPVRGNVLNYTVREPVG